jgi:hypothetical protein
MIYIDDVINSTLLPLILMSTYRIILNQFHFLTFEAYPYSERVLIVWLMFEAYTYSERVLTVWVKFCGKPLF